MIDEVNDVVETETVVVTSNGRTLGANVGGLLATIDPCTKSWNDFAAMHSEMLVAQSKKGDGVCPAMEFAFRAGWAAHSAADVWE